MPALRLGWIGLGSMGLHMAQNLQKYLQSTGGPGLLYTNRTLSRGADLEAMGGIPKDSVAQVVQNSDVIFSCISNDSVLRDIVSQIVQSGDIAGKVFVDSSTVHPETSGAASQDLVSAGASFIAAPVFGASAMAKAGKLVFCVAGPAASKSIIQPYLKDVMGKAVIDLGEDVSKSSLLKIAGNIIVVNLMEIISETHVFAEKTGLGCDILETMIGEMFGPVALSYSKRLTTGAYAPPKGEKAGFGVDLAIKDAQHAINCASAAGTSLPVSELALGNLLAAKSFGEADDQRSLDSSSMYGILRQNAGLDFYTDYIKLRE